MYVYLRLRSFNLNFQYMATRMQTDIHTRLAMHVGLPQAHPNYTIIATMSVSIFHTAAYSRKLNTNVHNGTVHLSTIPKLIYPGYLKCSQIVIAIPSNYENPVHSWVHGLVVGCMDVVYTILYTLYIQDFHLANSHELRTLHSETRKLED